MLSRLSSKDGKTDVPGGLGYLVKQWPVDEYVRFYNDEKHQKRMLEEGIFLNDIYFFIQQGLVKLYHRDEVQHISGKKYRLGDEGDFDIDVFDPVVFASVFKLHFCFQGGFSTLDLYHVEILTFLGGSRFQPQHLQLPNNGR